MEIKDKNQAQYPGMVVYTCDFSTQKWEQEDQEFETSLGYTRLSLKKENKHPPSLKQSHSYSSFKTKENMQSQGSLVTWKGGV